jgi:hypothetical protein
MAKPIEPGARKLWVDTIVFLDKLSSTGSSTWVLPREQYFDFGNCNQAYFSIQFWCCGPGAAGVTLDFERTTQTDSPDQFESMLDTPITFTASSSGWKERDIGRNTAANDKWPRGIGRVVLKNTDATAGHFAAIRVRIWNTTQSFTASSGMAA